MIISRMRKFLLLCLLMSSSAVFPQTTHLLSDSLEILKKYIASNPNDIDLRLRKAAVNIELSQWEYAVEEYGRVLKMQPDNLAALYFRAYANMNLRQYAFSRDDYKSILLKLPKHFEARLGLAYVLERMGRDRDASDELNRLVEFHPDSASAYAARAAFEVKRKSWDVALYDWNKACELKPTQVDYAVSKVDVLLQMKKRREAHKMLNELVERGLATKPQLMQWYEKCK